MIVKDIVCDYTLSNGHVMKIPGREYRSQTHSNNEHWNGDIDVAVITIDQRKAIWLVGLINIVRGLKAIDHDVFKLYVHDLSVRWYEGDWDEEAEEGDENEEIPALKLDPEEGPDGDQWTEYDYVVVYDDSVVWQSTPKHSEIDVTTDSISLPDLEEIVALPPVKKPEGAKA